MKSKRRNWKKVRVVVRVGDQVLLDCPVDVLLDMSVLGFRRALDWPALSVTIEDPRGVK